MYKRMYEKLLVPKSKLPPVVAIIEEEAKHEEDEIMIE